MTEHTATIATAPWQTTVTCSCGWTFEHPDPSIAEHRHAQHVGIEQARKALRRETAALREATDLLLREKTTE